MKEKLKLLIIFVGLFNCVHSNHSNIESSQYETCPNLYCDGYTRIDYSTCSCICLRDSCPAGRTLDKNRCKCDLDPSTPTSSVASSDVSCNPPKSCGTGLAWFPAPICGCRPACDYVKSCPPGSQWDFTACNCISTMKSSSDVSPSSPSSRTSCPRLNCGFSLKPNYETCTCYCPLTSCPQGDVFNKDFCACYPGPSSESVVVKSVPSSDVSPSWRTSCPRLSCGLFRRPDYETCTCICDVMGCPNGFTFDEVYCECVGRPSSDQVVTSSSPPSEPQCERVEPCERGYYWMPAPFCQCFLACDYIMSCPSGQKWDFIECGCILDTSLTTEEPETDCPGEAVWNEDTCSCECPLTPTDCRGRHQKLDRKLCKCVPKKKLC